MKKSSFWTKKKFRYGCILFLFGLLGILWFFRISLAFSTLFASLEIHDTAVQQEVIELLGQNTKKRYLVALMNTNEKKPDGGFFGSYAIIELGPTSWSVDFFDSYYPQTIKDAKVPLPDRFTPVFDTKDIGFLGVNMLGFTNLDGPNVYALYQQTFPDQPLDGVVFVKSDVFNLLLPDFDILQTQWEFHNATVDLQRGINTGNKKEHYFSEIHYLMSPGKLWRMGRNIRKHQTRLLRGGYIRVYIPDSSSNLQQYLSTHNLFQSYHSGTLYAFDYNLGFNKIDRFVSKSLSINEQATSLIQKTPDLQHVKIVYDVNIPSTYQKVVRGLAKTYGVVLGMREKTILSIEPQFYTRGIIHFPLFCKDILIQGDAIESKQRATPFSHIVQYDIVGKGSTFTRKIVMTMHCE